MKRKNQNKIMALCLAFLFLFTGCSAHNRVVNDPQSAGTVTTITFFGNKYEAENVTVIEQIISDFMKQNPDIRVQYESLKGNAYYEALEKRMAAGKGDDVFMVNHDILLQLEKKGQVADLSGLSTIDSYTDDMLGQMKGEKGEIYWLPTTVSMFGLYCNLDLLKAHHQLIPENLAEWEQVCEYFTAQGITPIVANNDISLKTLVIGAGFYDTYQAKEQKETFARLNTDEQTLSAYLEPGFALVQNLIDKGYLDPAQTLETKKTSDDLEQFVQGESPFMLSGAWAAGRVKAMTPGFEFAVAPLPVLAEDNLLVINPDTRLSVNADSAHIEAAMKFVEFFTSEKNIEKFAGQQCSFSPLKGGNQSLIPEIQLLRADYEAGKTVIGADSLLQLPIWNLSAEAVQKQLSGEPLDQVMRWLDEQAGTKREVQQ